MIGVIVLLDQLVWRPIIAWADKFKFEQVEAPKSCELLSSDPWSCFLCDSLLSPADSAAGQSITCHSAQGARRTVRALPPLRARSGRSRKAGLFILGGLVSAGLIVAIYFIVRAELSDLHRRRMLDAASQRRTHFRSGQCRRC